MSRYDELLQAFVNANKDYYADRAKCLEFSKQLVKGLHQYLDAPAEHIRLCPAYDPPEKDKKYHLEQTIALNNNSYWEFGVEIDFTDKSALNTLMLRVPFEVQQNGNVFKIKIGNLSWKVANKDDLMGFQEIYAFVYQALVKNIKASNYPGAKTNPFGFIID